MGPLSDLKYLLEPSSLALIATALSVVLLSAHRALLHDRDSQRHRDLSAAAITLDANRALLLPLASSVSLLLMFYLFASLSQLVTAFAAVASASATGFALYPVAVWVNTALGWQDPLVTLYCPSFAACKGQRNSSSSSSSSVSGQKGDSSSSTSSSLLGEGGRGREGRGGSNSSSGGTSNCSNNSNRSSSSSLHIRSDSTGEAASTLVGAVTRMQAVLGVMSAGLVGCWLVSGHWLLNNLLGTAICVAFVSHVRLPNVKVCALLLSCLFAYDIFWVFFSSAIFGANVMVSVATQHAHNPAHTVAQSLRLPSAVARSIVREIELPVKLLFPRDLFGELGSRTGGRARDFMVLGLGDMAIPGMLLALVLCFDQHKRRQQQQEEEQQLQQQQQEMETLQAQETRQEQLQEESHVGEEKSQKNSWEKFQLLMKRPLLEACVSVPLKGAGGSNGAQLGYVWVAAAGYAVGLLAALAAGVLTRSPQPALLYLVPSTLGPVSLVAWRRGELGQLWEGHPGLLPFDQDKLHTLDV